MRSFLSNIVESLEPIGPSEIMMKYLVVNLILAIHSSGYPNGIKPHEAPTNVDVASIGDFLISASLWAGFVNGVLSLGN
jgi:hypothetical protein